MTEAIEQSKYIKFYTDDFLHDGGIMDHLKSFFTDPKPEGKFIAIFADGSGASLFWAVDGENGLPAYVDHEGDLITDSETYFIDAGYSHWIPLPDSFQFWFEQTP